MVKQKKINLEGILLLYFVKNSICLYVFISDVMMAIPKLQARKAEKYFRATDTPVIVIFFQS